MQYQYITDCRPLPPPVVTQKFSTNCSYVWEADVLSLKPRTLPPPRFAFPNPLPLFCHIKYIDCHASVILPSPLLRYVIYELPLMNDPLSLLSMWQYVLIKLIISDMLQME